MTIYKAFKTEAETAAELAFDLLNGIQPSSTLVNTHVNNGKEDVPSILLTPLAVTQNNIKSTIVADGFWSVDQICTSEYAKACVSEGLK